MASFVDIVPALGRGLSFAQNLPGGYDAIDARRAALLGLQEGALYSTSYKVSQRGAGANMTVDVAANDGLQRAGGFVVEGDDVLHQGLYHVPPLAAIQNLDVGASHPTNPRIDQVVIEARDDQHTGDGITRARLYVLQGTPTAGATLANRNGAVSGGSYPPSTARLADILVPAGSTTVTTANIRDRRQWASGANAYAEGVASGPTVATSADTALTDMTVTTEFSGAPVVIEFNGSFQHSAQGIETFMRPRIDGAGLNSASGYRSGAAPAVNAPFTIAGRWVIAAIGAGRHTIDLAWATVSGTATAVQQRRALHVYEDVRQLNG